MALLKLWNALRGRPATEPSQAAPSSPPASSDATSFDPTSSDGGPSQVKASPTKAPPRKVKSGGLSLFGSGSVDSALMKQLRGVTASSVLEIIVGDGTRAMEALDCLAANAAKAGHPNPSPIRYVAMDQFEMGGGSHTLKAFHQTMRTGGVRPQVFPEPVDRGLLRVAHTIGAIDLVLISEDAGDPETSQMKSLLSRITHDASVILFQRDQTWHRLVLSEAENQPVHRRAA